MEGLPIYLIAIIVILLAAVAIAVWALKRNKKPKIDYRGFFYGGILVLAIGLLYGIYRQESLLNGVVAMGIISTAMGLSKKSEWGK